MKTARIILTIVWILFGCLQFNDAAQYGNHDSYFWIIFYFTIAALTAATSKWRVPAWAFPCVIGFCVGAALFRMQDAVGNFDFSAPFRATGIPSHMNATTQAPNEVDGLLLVAGWIGVLWWKKNKR